MNPSLSATEFLEAGPSPFISFEMMGQMVSSRRLYADRLVGIAGDNLQKVAKSLSMQAAEDSINGLVRQVREAKPKTAEKSLAEAKRLAKSTDNPHELHYIASMFINHPEVVREVAKNPNIDEKTQRVILNDSKLGKDRHILRALGDNPAIGPVVMTHILNNAEDPFALQAVTQNAVRKALQSNGADTPFVKICDQISGQSMDPALRLIALAGARDGEVLRRVARTRDVAFGARELEAVADNRFTPLDVLSEMAGVSQLRRTLQTAVGVTVAQRAARTLQNMEHPELQREALAQP